MENLPPARSTSLGRNVDTLRVTLMAPAPAVDKWGADGFVTKLPPAGVLTGIKYNCSLQRGQLLELKKERKKENR